MKEVALSEVKDDLSRYLRLAADEQIIITRHGKAAGILIGFASEDDWFDYRLENDPRFLTRVAAARASLKAAGGTRLEDIEEVAVASKPPPSKPKKRRRSRRRR
jgi:prevent-host-death family protein